MTGGGVPAGVFSATYKADRKIECHGKCGKHHQDFTPGGQLMSSEKVRADKRR